MSIFVNPGDPIDQAGITGSAGKAQPFSGAPGENAIVGDAGGVKAAPAGGGHKPTPPNVPSNGHNGGYIAPSSSPDAGQPSTEDYTRQMNQRLSSTSYEYGRQHAFSGEPQTKEGYMRNRNDETYELGKAGNPVAAASVKDTDAVIADARGDDPRSEYADAGNGAVNTNPEYVGAANKTEK